MQSELLSYEKRLEHQNSVKAQSNFAQSPSVNVVFSWNTIGSKPQTNLPRQQGNGQRGNGGNPSFSNQNSAGRGRGRGRSGGNNRPMCQVCGKFGHTALICYHRFDKEYSPSSNEGRGSGGAPMNSNTNPTVFATQASNPFVATLETVGDPSWYADSAATNHVTPDYNNITHPTEYGGTALVTVGNGEKLQISYTGNVCLTNGRNELLLKNVMCVLAIAKNLLSVSQLVEDNVVYVEFYDDCCLIKEKYTGCTLLKGELSDGLYRLNEVKVVKGETYDENSAPYINKDSTALFLAKSRKGAADSRALWYRRLGYPS